MKEITGADIGVYVDLLVGALRGKRILSAEKWRAMHGACIETMNGYVAVETGTEEMNPSKEVLRAKYVLEHRTPVEFELRDSSGAIIVWTVDRVADATPSIRDMYGNEWQQVLTPAPVPKLYACAQSLVIEPRKKLDSSSLY